MVRKQGENISHYGLWAYKGTCKHRLFLWTLFPYLTQNLGSEIYLYGENYVDSTIDNFSQWYNFNEFNADPRLFFPSSLWGRLLSLSWVLNQVWKLWCTKNISFDSSQFCDVPTLWETWSNWVWEKAESHLVLHCVNIIGRSTGIIVHTYSHGL